MDAHGDGVTGPRQTTGPVVVHQSDGDLSAGGGGHDIPPLIEPRGAGVPRSDGSCFCSSAAVGHFLPTSKNPYKVLVLFALPLTNARSRKDGVVIEILSVAASHGMSGEGCRSSAAKAWRALTAVAGSSKLQLAPLRCQPERLFATLGGKMC